MKSWILHNFREEKKFNKTATWLLLPRVQAVQKIILNSMEQNSTESFTKSKKFYLNFVEIS